MVRVLLAALAAGFVTAGAAAAETRPPVRIALALPYEGRLSPLAAEVERGWRIALAEAAGKTAGRKVEIVKVDTAADPATARAKVEPLLQAGKVDLVAGVINSGVAAALGALANRHKRPLVVAYAIADEITGELCSPYVVRTSFSAHAFHFAAGRHLAHKSKTVVTIGPDVPIGHALLGAFAQGFKAGGGTVLRRIWTPVGRNPDWKAVLAEAQATGAKMIFAFYDGPDSVGLVRVHARAGLKKTMPLVGAHWLYSEAQWAAMGDAALGALTIVPNLASLGQPANRRFVAAYRKRFKADPGIPAFLGYENAKPILATIAALGGRIEDGRAFVKALTGATYELPRGKLAFNSDNDAILAQLYLARLVREKGGITRRYVELVPGADDAPGCRMGR